MPFPLLAAGAAISLANQVGKWFGGNKQSKEAKKINPVWTDYQSNPYAARQLAMAQNMFGGRMAGAPQMERNILSSQGNTMANVNRNATDASQALAYGAASQGQADQSFTDLQTAESQNKYNMLGNLNNAYGAMINEGDKVYQNKMQKFMIDSQRKDALANAGAQNKYGAGNDLSSMFMQLGMLNGGNAGGRSNASVSNSMVLQNPLQRTQTGNVNQQFNPMMPTPFNPNRNFQQSSYVPGLANFLNRPR